MSYLILARKYRPQKFSDLAGQETTSKILLSAIAQSRVAPAYLFSGPRGTGKTTTARLFAKALNCKKPKNSEPCNTCASCEDITKSSSMDVLELDAASHTGVDNIREVIINTVAYAAARDKYKIFIIDEVHMLSNQSFNALLKTLEEPPPYVTFILATTEYHKIPATIASRCQRFRFLPLTNKEIGLTLKNVAQAEKISIQDEAIALLARAASGSMRDALSLFDQVLSHVEPGKAKEAISLSKTEDILGVVREDFLTDFIEQVADRNPKGALESLGRLLADGHDLSYFLKETREAFRQMLIEKCGYKDEDALSTRKSPFPTSRFTLQELLRGGQMLSKCAEQMRWNDSPRMVFECYTVKLCQEALDVPEILKRLENLEKGGPSLAPIRKEAQLNVPQVTVPSPIRAESSQFKAPSLSVAPSNPPTISTQVLEQPRVEPSQASTPASYEQAWRKILDKVHQDKPSLYPTLQQATFSLKGSGAAELGFAKQFSLDTAKRNLAFLQEIVSSELNQQSFLSLKLVQGQPKPSVQSATEDDEASASGQDDDTIVVEPLHSTYEAMDQGETFEPLSSTPSVIEDAIEDEGTKKFLNVFHGKVTRHQDH